MSRTIAALLELLNKEQLTHVWNEHTERQDLILGTAPRTVPCDAASIREAISTTPGLTLFGLLGCLPDNWHQSKNITETLGLAENELICLPHETTRKVVVLEALGLTRDFSDLDRKSAQLFAQHFKLPCNYFEAIIAKPFPTDKNGIGECGLNLKEIADSVFECENVVEAYKKKDGFAFVVSVLSNSLAVVFDNVFQLKASGMYEVALRTAFPDTRTNYHSWDPGAIAFLFQEADRDALLAAGDPLPGRGPFTIFRGVAGKGKHRRVGGFAWTSSLELACWYAVRLFQPDPAVLQATVTAEQLYCFIEERQEFLVRPRNPQRMKLSQAEIAKHAEAFIASEANRDDESLETVVKNATPLGKGTES